jgi:hypothetical protein
MLLAWFPGYLPSFLDIRPVSWTLAWFLETFLAFWILAWFPGYLPGFQDTCLVF